MYNYFYVLYQDLKYCNFYPINFSNEFNLIIKVDIKHVKFIAYFRYYVQNIIPLFTRCSCSTKTIFYCNKGVILVSSWQIC